MSFDFVRAGATKTKNWLKRWSRGLKVFGILIMFSVLGMGDQTTDAKVGYAFGIFVGAGVLYALVIGNMVSFVPPFKMFFEQTDVTIDAKVWGDQSEVQRIIHDKCGGEVRMQCKNTRLIAFMQSDGAGYVRIDRPSRTLFEDLVPVSEYVSFDPETNQAPGARDNL